MLGFEKLADWWERQKKDSEHALDSFVDAYPNLFGVAVAGSTKTAMDLGGGFVDVLRTGEGVKKGGSGYVEDALRVVSLAGPVARLGRFGLTKLVPDVAGPLCARISATQALRMTGVRHFAEVGHLIERLFGRTISSMAEIAPDLRALGAEVRNLGSVKSLEQVAQLARKNPKGVLTFGVKWATAEGQLAGHSLIAYRDWLGRVRFLDRTGVIFKTLEELEAALSRAGKTYEGIEKAVPHGQVLYVANSTVVTTTNGASAVAVETRALMLTSENKATQLFDEFRKRSTKQLKQSTYGASH